MKKLLFSSILFSMGVHGQKNTTGIDSSQIKFVAEPPDSTGFGTPDRALISKTLDRPVETFHLKMVELN